jgi:hypothetical protein
VEFLNGLLVETEILLAAYENDRETLAEMEDFRNPLCVWYMLACAYLRGVPVMGKG